MKKEEIYLNLSKLSEKEKEYVEDVTNQNTKDRNFIHFLEEKNKWLSFHSWEDDYIYKTEITFNQFKELFEPTYKKGDIVICQIEELEKVEYIVKLKDVNEVTAEKFIFKSVLEDGYSDILKGGKFNKILRLANEQEINLLEPKEFNYNSEECVKIQDEMLKNVFGKDFKIGDTFEHNGFICEVKEPVKKWVYDKERKSYIKTENPITGIDKIITNQEFINQLEKHAR